MEPEKAMLDESEAEFCERMRLREWTVWTYPNAEPQKVVFLDEGVRWVVDPVGGFTDDEAFLFGEHAPDRKQQPEPE